MNSRNEPQIEVPRQLADFDANGRQPAPKNQVSIADGDLYAGVLHPGPELMVSGRRRPRGFHLATLRHHVGQL